MSTDPTPSYVHELGRPNTADALRQVQTERAAAVTESPTAAKRSSPAATTALFLVGMLLMIVGVAVLFPATSLFVGILGAVLMLIGGNALIGGAIITGLRR